MKFYIARFALVLVGVAVTAGVGGAAGASAGTGVSIRPVCNAVPAGYALCFSLVRGDALPFASGPSGYGPADLQAAYALPSSTAGAGQTVAIVDACDATAAESDLAQSVRSTVCRPAPRRTAASGR